MDARKSTKLEDHVRFMGGLLMKTCSRCKQELPLDQFTKNKTKKDGLSYSCKECDRQYRRQHYLDNKAYYRNKANKRKEVIREWFRELKSELKCEKCGFDHPAALDFHHTGDKDMALSMAVRNTWSKERLLSEMAKCQVLCSNCHRILHYEEDNIPE